jgi:predicted aspartyl protease
MRLQVVFGSLAILLPCFMQSPAWAEECGPLKQIASLDLVSQGSRMLVPVTINGAPKQMLLNTGGGISNLQGAAVEAMGLHPIDASRVKMLDSAGNASQFYVQVDDFGMGAIHGPNMQFVVTNAANANLPFVGSLAGDVMGQYDVEMDFAAHKLNFFSKDHCPGHVLYWNPTAVAVVPISLQAPTPDANRVGFRRYVPRDVHIFVPVMLDGKPFRAMINTGANNSTISEDVAKFQFGITADSPGSTPLGNFAGDPNHKVFGHVFSSLTFDGVTVTNAHVAVIPNLIGSKDPNNSFRTDTRIGRVDDNFGPDITIGMDVLRKLHLFIAFGERKLYVTPAAAPVAAAQ